MMTVFWAALTGFVTPWCVRVVAQPGDACGGVLRSRLMRPPVPTVAVAMHRVVAFQSVPGLCPYKDFPAFFEYLAALVL